MEKNSKNMYNPYAYVGDFAEGMQWPEGRVLPKFATPAEELDALVITDLTLAERTMFSVLQGIVNARKPRIFLYGNREEGLNKWKDLLELKTYDYSVLRKYEVLAKYANEISGVVLYDQSKSVHYINLACTICNIKKAIPVDLDTYEKIQRHGINLPIVEDITHLEYLTAIDIYNYLYEKYWSQCTHRLIFSMDPIEHGYFIRDMAAATGSAVVWLENRNQSEKDVMVKFFKDMTPGESIALGWYTEERSGIGCGTQNGISTIPSDYFENSTVYAGQASEVSIPKVPKKPDLENKFYVALFLSDGDNVQYNQHKMQRLWENKGRGTVPINWTISPGLIDFAPAMLNYYYTTATPNDFFASGPSGIGYALTYDAHNDILNFTKKEHVEAYAKFSETYLEKSGLRVITVWDEVNDYMMDAYTDNCRYLYGLTYEDWTGSHAEGTAQPIKINKNKTGFIPNNPPYTPNIDDMYNAWKRYIDEWDGNKPLFYAAQGDAWFMTPENLTKLSERLNELAPGKVEFLRGDQFFALFNEANGLPFNLTLSKHLTVESSDPSSDANVVIDGTPSGDVWSTQKTEKWLKFDFGDEYMLERYVVRYAGDNCAGSGMNTRDFTLEVSLDGSKWTVIDKQVGNEANVTDIDISPVKTRYARLTIDNAGPDNWARIAEVELYGRVIKEK